VDPAGLTRLEEVPQTDQSRDREKSFDAGGPRTGGNALLHGQDPVGELGADPDDDGEGQKLYTQPQVFYPLPAAP